MKKQDFILQAFQAGAYTNRMWVIKLFSVTNDKREIPVEKMKDWFIKRTTTGVFVKLPEALGGQLEPLEGASLTEPIARMLDPIELPAGSFVSVKEKTLSSIGNLLFNCCALMTAFGDKIPYMVGDVKIADVLEPILAKRLEDTPSDPSKPRDHNTIYVDEYLLFCKSFSYLTEFSQLCTWGVTPKAITPPPNNAKVMKELMEKYKDQLDDPEVAARIDAALQANDAEYLKGDPSMNFLITDKSRKVVRKKMFLAYGSEGGLGTASKPKYVTKSLYEGWDLDNYSGMINALRAGSYDRGAETVLGGEAVKWLLRASSNIQIKDGDCGSRMGLLVEVRKDTIRLLVNSYVITQNGVKLVESSDEAGSYMGKRLMVRSPMFCSLEKTDFCATCLGVNLSRNKNAATVAVTQEGSIMMLIFMKAMHGKQIALQTLDIETAFI